MNKNTLLAHKNRSFIHPELIHSGYAFYAIRISLLAAIDELKTKIQGRVLDLGCGIMPYKEYLEENGQISEYIGVDLEQSDYHNTLKPHLFWDGFVIPMEDNSCDWIIATEFLEHYHETESILSEINRVLKPGGTFFFTVPCIWTLHEVPYDAHRFTPFTLEKHFTNTKFTNIEIKALGGNDLSLAITYGLWLDNAGFEGWKKRFFRRIFKGFFHFLLKRDKKTFSFENGKLPSGLYGFIKK